MFAGASRRAGIKRLRPHQLRHASGTYMLDATGDLRLVQEHLGHKDISSTQIYTQISALRKRQGMDRMRTYLKAMHKREKVRGKIRGQ